MNCILCLILSLLSWKAPGALTVLRIKAPRWEDLQKKASEGIPLAVLSSALCLAGIWCLGKTDFSTVNAVAQCKIVGVLLVAFAWRRHLPDLFTFHSAIFICLGAYVAKEGAWETSSIGFGVFCACIAGSAIFYVATNWAGEQKGL